MLFAGGCDIEAAAAGAVAARAYIAYARRLTAMQKQMLVVESSEASLASLQCRLQNSLSSGQDRQYCTAWMAAA